MKTSSGILRSLTNKTQFQYLPFKFAKVEFKGGIYNFKVFMLCLVLGVMAITSISSLRESIKAGLNDQSAKILGGDASMRFTYRVASVDEKQFIRDNSEIYTEIISLRSMISVIKDDLPIDSTLVKIKGVDQNYPIYGSLDITPTANLLEALGEKNGIYGLAAARPLVDRLSLEIGQYVRLGSKMFQLRAKIISEPDDGNPFSFAPRVIVLNKALISGNLIAQGTMFDSSYNIKLLPDQTVEQLRNKAQQK